MKTFKIIFDVSILTQVPNTYINSEMWIKFEVDNIDTAEEEAFRAIVYELIEVQHNIIKKLEIIEIQEVEEISENEDKVIQSRKYKILDDE